MYKWIFAIGGLLIIIAAGFFLFFNAAPRSSTTNYPPRSGPIVAFGDSLTAGTGATAGSDYPSDLAKLVGQPIVNEGVSGNTTAQALERINAILALRPSITIVLLGGNDYLQDVATTTTFENLAAIVHDLQSNGSVVVLVGIRGGILTDPYAAPFQALAQQTGSIYVPDALAGLIGNAQLMSDEVHPNDAGYAIIAQKIYQALAAAKLIQHGL